MPSRLFTVLAAAGLTVASLTGCAAQQKYQELDAAYRTELSRRQELEQQVDSLRQEIDALQARLADSEGAFGSASGTNQELRDRLARLLDQYRQLEERLNGLGVALNPETDAALQALAAQYPGLITYDAQRGLLRFASDLTFDLGSAEVRSEARQSLEQLARVLNSSSATNYDLRIVGHTDNVRISSGTASRHPTNTHLSAHRAIAVRDVLASGGVTPVRMQVAGWGEYRPAVPNRAGRGGTVENRRVEIFILPATPSIPVDAPTSTPSQPQAPASRAPAEIPIK
ncbi:MAG: OmpA family protein [Phycisphaerales bacterium]